MVSVIELFPNHQVDYFVILRSDSYQVPAFWQVNKFQPYLTAINSEDITSLLVLF